eukprot:2448835-Pyramimonas_sp.AAC.1
MTLLDTAARMPSSRPQLDPRPSTLLAVDVGYALPTFLRASRLGGPLQVQVPSRPPCSRGGR